MTTGVTLSETSQSESRQPRIPIKPTSLNNAGSLDLYADYDPKIAQLRATVSKAASPTGAIDPLTWDILRMRNAALQGCNYCQSFRTRSAVELGMDEPMVADIKGDYEKSELLTERQKVGLRLLDAFVLGFGHASPELAKAVAEQYSPAEIQDMVFKMFSFSTNKITISLAADDEENADRRFGIRMREDFYGEETLFNPDDWR